MALYLEGDILGLYLETDNVDQQVAEIIKQSLKEVFTEGLYVMFAKLGKENGWESM